MGNIADLAVGVRGDISKLPADLAAGESKLEQFAKKAETHGTAAGKGLGKGMDRAGIEAANGWVRGADGKLRDSQGRFVSAGDQAAAGLDAGLTRGLKQTEGKLGAFVSRWTKRLAVGLGAGALLFSQTAVGAEAAFSQTMNTIQATTDANADQFEKLGNLALDMGAKTSFSANDAANAMLELAKSGLKPATIQAGALEGTLLLAAAGGTDMGTAATIASNAMNTFSIKGKKMSAVAAALAGGANASSASVESLGQGLQQVGPGATNAGLSLNETVAVLSAFDAAGVKGSDAGTSLKTMLSRLVPQTQAATATMDELGISFVKRNGEFKSISTIAEILRTKMSKLSDAERTTAMHTLFGSDATRAATVLMKEGAGGIEAFIKATQDQGAAQKTADARMKGTAGAIENFKGAIETAQIELGLLFKPYVVAGLGKLTKGVNRAVPAVKSFVGEMKDGTGTGGAFADVLKTTGSVLVTLATGGAKVIGFFADHRTTTLALVIALGALVLVTKAHAAAMAVAAAGGLAKWLLQTNLITAATKVWTAVNWALNASILSNPIVLIVVGLVALGAALVIAYKKSETFRNIVDGAFRKVMGAAKTAFGWIKSNWPLLLAILTGPFGIAVLAIVKNWDRIKAGGKAALGWVKGNWPTILAVLTGPFGLAVLAIVKNWDKITGAGKRAVAYIKSIPGKITGALGDLGSLLVNAGAELIDGLISGIRSKIDDLGDVMGSVGGKIKGFLPGSPVKEGPLRSWNNGGAGKRLMKMLVLGIKDGQPGVEKQMSKVTAAIDRSLKNKQISKSQAAAMKAEVKATEKHLNKIARSYEKHAAKLKQLQDDRASMKASIASSISGELDLGSLITTTEPNQYGFGGGQSITFATVATAVSSLAARAKKFAGKLRALLKAGIPKGLVQEVAGLGTTQGMVVADALLSGNKTQIKSLAADYAAVQSSAAAVGEVVAGAFYDTGIAAQKGILKGLLEDKAIKKAAKQLAAKLEKSIRAELGIKSPSRRLYKSVGLHAGAGVGEGAIDGLAPYPQQIAGVLDRTRTYLDARAATAWAVPTRPSDLPVLAGSDSLSTGMPDPAVLQWLVAALVEAIKGLQVQVEVGLGGRQAARIVQAGTTKLSEVE